MRGGGGQNSQKNGYVVSGCPLRVTQTSFWIDWHKVTLGLMPLFSTFTYRSKCVGIAGYTYIASDEIQNVIVIDLEGESPFFKI